MKSAITCSLILIGLSFSAFAQEVKGVAELKTKVRWQSNDSFTVDQLVLKNMKMNGQKAKPLSCKFRLGSRVDGVYSQSQSRNEVENYLLSRGVVYVGFESVPEAPFLPAPKIDISPEKKNAWDLFQKNYLPVIHQRASDALKTTEYIRWMQSVNLPAGEVQAACAEIKIYLSTVYRMKTDNITCEGTTFSTNLLKEDWIKQSRYYYFPLTLESCEYAEEAIEWEN